LDYGANSYRSLVVNLDNGAEVASYVYPYPSGSRAASSAPVVQPHERAEERLDARAVQRQDLRRAQGRR